MTPAAVQIAPFRVMVDPAEVPDYGRATRLRGVIVLDFSPDLRGSKRYLWSLKGTAFESEAEAERILSP